MLAICQIYLSSGEDGVLECPYKVPVHHLDLQTIDIFLAKRPDAQSTRESTHSIHAVPSRVNCEGSGILVSDYPGILESIYQTVQKTMQIIYFNSHNLHRHARTAFGQYLES